MVSIRHSPEEPDNNPQREAVPSNDTPVFSEFCLSLCSKPLSDGVPTCDTEEKWNTLSSEIIELDLSAEKAIAVSYPLVQFVELELPIADDRRRQAYSFLADALSDAEYYGEAVGVRIRLAQWFDHITETTRKIDFRSLQNHLEIALCYQSDGEGELACEALSSLVRALPPYVTSEGRSVEAIENSLRIARSAVDVAQQEKDERLGTEIDEAVIELTWLPNLSLDRALEGGWCSSETSFKLESVWYVVAVRCLMIDSDSDRALRATQARLKCCELSLRVLENEDQNRESFPEALREAKIEVVEATYDIATIYCSRGEFTSAAASLGFLLRFADACDQEVSQDIFTLANHVIQNLVEPDDPEKQEFDVASDLYLAGFSNFPLMPNLHALNSVSWILEGADFMRRSVSLVLSENAFRLAGVCIKSLAYQKYEVPVELQCEYLLGLSAVELDKLGESEEESAESEFYSETGSVTEDRLRRVLSLCSGADFEKALLFEVMTRCYLARFAHGRADISEMLSQARAARGILGSDPDSFPIDLLGVATEIGILLGEGGDVIPATEVMRLAYEAALRDFNVSRFIQAGAALSWANSEVELATDLATQSEEVDCDRAEEAIRRGFDLLDRVDPKKEDIRFVKLGLLRAKQEVRNIQSLFDEVEELQEEIECIQDDLDSMDD